MTKNQTSKKEDHQFTLNRLQKYCRLSNVLVDFTPNEK